MVHDPRLGSVYGSSESKRSINCAITEAAVDLSKFKTSDWLKVGGGAVMLIAYFLDWTSADCPSIPGIGTAYCDSNNLSGSSFFFRGTIPWILTVAVGVIAFLLAAGIMKKGTLPWPLIFLAATALATLLVFIYLVHPTYSGFDSGRGIGAILGFLGAAAALVGSFLGFKESGGDLNDLKDINKLKGQFSGGPGAPPPPPGMQPPPPPPPPGGGFTPPPPPPV